MFYTAWSNAHHAVAVVLRAFRLWLSVLQNHGLQRAKLREHVAQLRVVILVLRRARHSPKEQGVVAVHLFHFKRVTQRVGRINLSDVYNCLIKWNERKRHVRSWGPGWWVWRGWCGTISRRPSASCLSRRLRRCRNNYQRNVRLRPSLHKQQTRSASCCRFSDCTAGRNNKMEEVKTK